MIDMDSVYRVERYKGVAWRISGYKQKLTTESHWVKDQYGDDLHVELGEWEDDIDSGVVLAYMVGDDRLFEIDIDELIEITEDEYCPGCGQIGCGAYH